MTVKNLSRPFFNIASG